MVWDLSNIFEQEGVTQYETTENGWTFQLDGIPTKISIELTVDPLNKRYRYRRSHAIRSPANPAAPYYPSLPFGETMEWALRQALSSITMYYFDSVERGHAPSADWLVPLKEIGYRGVPE